MESLEGAKELERWMKTFPKRIQNKALRKASRDGAKVVAEDAKRLVPEDTGTLAASIKVRALKRSRNKLGHGINVGSSKQFSTDGLPYYASFVELGTKHRPADPFLRPALWGNQEAIKRVFIKTLSKALKQEQGKADGGTG